jgi:hypothetical protein
MDNEINGEAVTVERDRHDNLYIHVLGRDGSMQSAKIYMTNPDLFIEDGTFTFSDSHEAKTQVRYAN